VERARPVPAPHLASAASRSPLPITDLPDPPVSSFLFLRPQSPFELSAPPRLLTSLSCGPPQPRSHLPATRARSGLLEAVARARDHASGCTPSASSASGYAMIVARDSRRDHARARTPRMLGPTLIGPCDPLCVPPRHAATTTAPQHYHRTAPPRRGPCAAEATPLRRTPAPPEPRISLTSTPGATPRPPRTTPAPAAAGFVPGAAAGKSTRRRDSSLPIDRSLI